MITQLNEMKANSNKFSLTLDEWTSLKNRRYMNVNTTPTTVVLIWDSCPSEVAKQLVEEKLAEFRLKPSDIVASTTDGAAVMVKFGRQTEYAHQTCYNHMLSIWPLLKSFLRKIIPSTEGE